jgi:hypothetical protein
MVWGLARRPSDPGSEPELGRAIPGALCPIAMDARGDLAIRFFFYCNRSDLAIRDHVGARDERPSQARLTRAGRALSREARRPPGLGAEKISPFFFTAGTIGIAIGSTLWRSDLVAGVNCDRLTN